MDESLGSSDEVAGTSSPCMSMQEDLLLYFYDDLEPARRAEVEGHLRGCGRCREELDSFRATLTAVDESGLRIAATVDRPGDWDALERRLRLSGGVLGHRLAAPARTLLRAAAIIAIAALSFAAGRQWDTVGTTVAGLIPETLRPVPTLSTPGVEHPDGLSPLQEFSRKTNDYLDRSRLVLLEFANAEQALDSPVLRQASRSLAKENTLARRVAGEVADQRLEDLVTELGNIMIEISHLSGPGDTTTMNRIRTYLDTSGLLDRLEIISAGDQRFAQRRPRV